MHLVSPSALIVPARVPVFVLFSRSNLRESAGASCLSCLISFLCFACSCSCPLLFPRRPTNYRLKSGVLNLGTQLIDLSCIPSSKGPPFGLLRFIRVSPSPRCSTKGARLFDEVDEASDVTTESTKSKHETDTCNKYYWTTVNR